MTMTMTTRVSMGMSTRKCEFHEEHENKDEHKQEQRTGG